MGLRSNKTAFVRKSLSSERFQWLGPRSGIGGIRYKSGKLDSDFARAAGWLDFVKTSRIIKPPSGTTFPVIAKEKLCVKLQEYWNNELDIDVRTKRPGSMTSDQTSWTMIKRICQCIASKDDSDREYSYSPTAEGETLITQDYISHRNPLYIYRVNNSIYKLYLEYDEFIDMAAVPSLAIRNDCELVLSAGDEDTGYGVGWGKDYKDLSFGLLTLARPFVNIDANGRIVVGVADDGLVYYSIVGGLGFAQSTGVSDGLIVKIFGYSEVFVGGANGNVYLSTDGGRIFATVETYNSVTGDIVGFTKAIGGYVYILCSNSYVAVRDGNAYARVSQTPVTTPTDILYANGILYVSGYDASGKPVIYVSFDDATTWEQVFDITGEHNLGSGFDYDPLVKMSSCGCGVVWASFMYSTGIGASATVHTAVYRSVEFGLFGTWELEWSDSALISDSSDVVFLPFDIKCCGPNTLYVAGVYWDRSWDILYYVSEEYKPGLLTFIKSCEDC